jgi:N-acetylneuraminic acid mutarotase
MWARAADANQDQVEGPSALYNNKMYVFSGFGCDQAGVCGAELENMTAVFDPAIGVNGQWTTLNAMPVGVTHVPAITVENEIWLVGGFRGNHGGPPIDTIQVYNPATDSWRYGPRLPTPFAAGGAAYVGRKVYVFGGLLPDRVTVTGAHYMYDLDNTAAGWQTMTPMPNPRNHLGFGVIAGRIYTIGGQIGHDCCTQDRDLVEVYDPVSNAWSTMNPIPDSISHMECGTFAKDGLIYVVGGNTQTYSTNWWMHSFDPEANAWTRMCDMPIKLWNPAAEIIGNEFIIAHGGEWAYQFPSEKTYRHTINRNIRRELGFWPKQLSLTLDRRQIANPKVNLHTISGETGFELNTINFPLWLVSATSSGSTISPNGEELELYIDPVAMTPGTYSFQLIVSEHSAGTQGYTPDTLQISLTVTTGSPLSIDQLDHFEVSATEAATALLEWETQSEEDLGFFSIERKGEVDQQFKVIHRVQPKGESGNQGAYYRFEDKQLEQKQQEIVYRLKYHSQDGRVSYSSPQSLWLEALDDNLMIYPNPASDHIFYRLEFPSLSICKVSIFDIKGKQLVSGLSGSAGRIDVQDLGPGCYIVVANTDKGTLRKKLIIK